MTRLLAGAFAAMIAATGVSGAAAQDEDGTGTRAVGLGVGVSLQPYAELDDEANVFPLPLLLLDGGKFSVSGTSASYRVFKSDRLEVAGTAEYRFTGYQEDDSPVFAGMDDRSGTLEAGGWAAYNIGEEVYLTVYAVHDVLDEHGGFELRGQAAYSWNPHVATNVTPVVGVTFQSEDLANHYFGVEADEAATLMNFAGSGMDFVRNAYAPGETLTPYVGVSARQAVSPDWAVFVFARHQFLPDEVQDSPLVDNDGASFFGAAVGRLF